jgi:hypothetical protein
VLACDESTCLMRGKPCRRTRETERERETDSGEDTHLKSIHFEQLIKSNELIQVLLFRFELNMIKRLCYLLPTKYTVCFSIVVAVLIETHTLSVTLLILTCIYLYCYLEAEGEQLVIVSVYVSSY